MLRKACKKQKEKRELISTAMICRFLNLQRKGLKGLTIHAVKRKEERIFDQFSA
jgi:hypothetical protein